MLKRIKQFFGFSRSDAYLKDILSIRSQLLSGSGPISMTVSDKAALAFAAYFASIKTIAELKATLPIHVYEIGKDGRASKTNLHPVNTLLKVAPNEDQTPFVWHETRMMHLLTWGNSYTELVFDPRSGEIAAAYPIMPHDVTPARDENKRRVYHISGAGTYDRSRIMHVLSSTVNGEVGLTPLRSYAGPTVGLGLAADRCVAKYMHNGGNPSIVAEYDGEMTERGYQLLKEDISSQIKDSNLLLMEKGSKVHAFNTSLSEVAIIGAREYQGKEMACRIFRLPPAVAGYSDHSPTPEDDRFLVKYTLAPWLERDEQTMTRDLFLPSERGRFYVQHNVDGLLRGDIKTRYEAFKTGLWGGFHTVNEIRDLLDLPPLDGGDELPKPAAIWGKPPNADQRSTPAAAATDPRFRDLTIQTVRGLINREAVALSRVIGKPDCKQRIAEFFGSQRGLIAERLSPLSPAADLLDRVIAEHRTEIEAEPALTEDRLNEITGRWLQQSETIADELIQVHSDSCPKDTDDATDN